MYSPAKIAWKAMMKKIKRPMRGEAALITVEKTDYVRGGGP
jgi:hypothetical protein